MNNTLVVHKHLKKSFLFLMLLLVLALISAACAGKIETISEAAVIEEHSLDQTVPAIQLTQATMGTATYAEDVNGIPTPKPASLDLLPFPISPAVPEERQLILEWPLKVRVGDSEIIRLILEMDSQGKLTPFASTEGGQVYSNPLQIPSLYDTHHVIAEARLDMAGIEYLPSGVVNEALLPGQPVTFIWSVRPSEIGTYQGTVWLHLRYLPKDGGPEVRSVLTAQLIEIESVKFLGLGGTAARVFGSVGVVVGSILGLDNLFSGIWNLFMRRKSIKR